MTEPFASVLIADDEERICEGLKKYFLANSKVIEKVYTASNGLEAFDLIVEFQPDAMVLDVQMPYKNGLEVMQEANRAGVCPKTIILSGYSEFNYAQMALRCGALDYIVKPCHPGEVLLKTEKILTKARGPQTDKGGNEDNLKNKNHFVSIAVDYIHNHFWENISLSDTASRIGISPAYLSTLFTHVQGCSFVDYLNKIRIDRACSFFYDPAIKTYEVAYKVGFKNEKYFSKVFKKTTGMSPSEFRKNITY